MRIGDLRRHIAIQQRTSTVDSWGQQSTAWSDLLVNVPAAIQALTGRELLAAQAINAEISYLITVRYHASLADPIKVAGMRAIYVNAGVTRIFNIQSAMNVDELNRQIDLMASEGLNQG